MGTTPDVPGVPGPELNDDDAAAFDDLGRRAGAALRRPAPPNGADEIAHRGRRQRTVKGVVAGGVALGALIGAMFVVSRGDGSDTSTPVDTVAPPDATTLPTAVTRPLSPGASPLEVPARAEVALASNAGTYRPGTGPTEVTAGRSHVSLRTCAGEENPAEPCDGTEGWAYVTGSADTPEVHYGLLPIADRPVLSALDARYFVASTPPSIAQDPPSAWLIDSVTGQRGPLTWQDEPSSLTAAEQVLVLFPAPHPVPFHTGPATRFLPRVVDRRDWTIRPLSVPEDASGALAIHQPGSGRIWIGTAPDGGDVGLAYTDDGGASWTDVALPESLRPTSEELLGVAPGQDELLVVAATGDHVAATAAWDGGDRAEELFVSDDAGQNWDAVPLDPADGNGRGLFVLADERLMVVMYLDLPAQRVLVSSSASDWSQLEESDPSQTLDIVRSRIEVYQDGTVLHYELSGSDGHMDVPVKFSTDLAEWWSIPGLVL